MLFITRFANESVMIRDDIEIKILRIDDSGCVCLGIQAPRDISVNRKEIHKQIKSITNKNIRNKNSLEK
jgi:carbon storage regulator